MVTITVYGTPGPQGSKRFLGIRGGKGVMVESSTKVKPWRDAVRWAVFDEWKRRGPGAHLSTDGAISVDMTFTLPRPKSAPKKRMYPDRKPDLSKLIRSTEDALTDAGAWEDDARVVRCFAQKLFVGDPAALDVPGCVIKIKEAL